MPLRFESFGGLRAIAAGLVIAYHAALAEGLTVTGALAPLAALLKGGVTVFFLISGFLLYLPYARAIRDGDRLPNWHSYARRRVLRILPGYWFALTVLGAASLAGAVFTVGWWRYYGLAQIYSHSTILGGVSVAWSLCVEATFYLCLPLFARGMALLCRGKSSTDVPRFQLTILGAVGLISLVWRGAISGSLVSPVPGAGVVFETALPGALDWFAIGMALAVVAATCELDPRRFRPVTWLARNGMLSWALAAVVYVAAARAQHGDVFLPLYGVSTHFALGLASALLVLPAIAQSSRTGPARVLRTRLLGWLGTISYGVYLWHDSLLRILHGATRTSVGHPGGLGQAVILFLGTAAGAIALGAGSWYLVERPAQRLGAQARPGWWPMLGRGPGLTRT